MHTAASPPAAPPPDDDATARRVHIRGIRELPTGYDAEIGTIFCEMRRASQLTKEELAEQFSTTLSTIDALETGALLALPEWAETSRVVTAYTEALGLDGRPILRRMALQISPDAIARRPAATRQPEPAAPPPPPEPPAARREDAERDAYDHFDPLPAAAEAGDTPGDDGAAKVEPPRRTAASGEQPIARRAVRWLMVAAMIGVGGYGAWFLTQRPGLLSSALDAMPEPIPRMARSAWELLGPLGDTMVRDPRSRKSDKLPVSGDAPANQ